MNKFHQLTVSENVYVIDGCHYKMGGYDLSRTVNSVVYFNTGRKGNHKVF